ncbi:MAG: EAL domain-containing protein [Pseudomonadota bacterium]
MGCLVDRILTSHLQGLLSSPTDFAIMSLDLDGDLVLWNAGAATLFDLRPDMAGISVADLLDGSAAKLVSLRMQMTEALQSGRACLTGWYKSVSLRRFWGEGTLSPIYDDEGTHAGYLKIIRDVSERQRAEQDVLLALQTDDLTGLANRVAFNSRLHEMLGALNRHHTTFILHLLDLDFFKDVNDTLGHQAGDQLLRQVGARLHGACRETDLVARLGGDEFAIIQCDVTTPSDGSMLAEKILKSLNEPFMLDENQASISASMGLALAPQDGKTQDELLRKADAALYRAKHSGRAAYSYFTRALDIEAQNRRRDIAAVRDAVQQHAFFLVYQPAISPCDQHLTGVEALLRCSHPVLAQRPIRDVIQLAEECGQMHRLSEWVMRQVCAQARLWFDHGHAKFRISLNLCARELGSYATLDLVDRALAHSALHASDLGVELTEQELFESKADGMKVLRALSERGVGIGLDDFGTGYSSLSYLTNLPVDQIKLDISFTRCLPHDFQVQKIVSAIINLAHALDLSVVGEGVESREQSLAMSRLQCDALQGFYFSRPMLAHRMTQWMKERSEHGH